MNDYLNEIIRIGSETILDLGYDPDDFDISGMWDTYYENEGHTIKNDIDRIRDFEDYIYLYIDIYAKCNAEAMAA